MTIGRRGTRSCRPILQITRRSSSLLLRGFFARLVSCRKGRSRVWLDDRGWWMGVVEFQPSSWSKGSYLNTGCMWLWNVHPHVAFDLSESAKGFHTFENERQFSQAIEGYCLRALEQMGGYRRKFASIQMVSDYT